MVDDDDEDYICNDADPEGDCDYDADYGLGLLMGFDDGDGDYDADYGLGLFY